MLHQHPGGQMLTKRMLDYCAFPANATVVDIGCGIGETVEYLRDHCGLKAVGLDLSKDRLEQGRMRAAGLLLLQGNSEQLPFLDASASGVIAECSLSVMQDTAKVVKEFRRILVAGGKLGITDLYVRNEEHLSSTCYLPEPGRQNCCMPDKDLLTILKENDFRVLVWEDQSVCLREFIAGYIMKYGLTEELLRCFPCCDPRNTSGDETRKVKLGYFLLVAEKRGMEG